MNLRDLIANLGKLPQDLVFPYGFGSSHSWRGVYSQLAFTPEKDVTVASMLEHAWAADGAVYTGYKGGEYLMTLDTPVNLAGYGVYLEDDPLGEARWTLMVELARQKNIREDKSPYTPEQLKRYDQLIDELDAASSEVDPDHYALPIGEARQALYAVLHKAGV